MTLVDQMTLDDQHTRPWLDPERIAAFQVDTALARVTWTPAHARLYGYRAGDVAPSMDLLHAHQHPSDRNEFRRLMRAAAARGAGFVLLHRIVTVDGSTHPVVTAVDVATTSVGATAVMTGVTRQFDDASAARSRLAAASAPDDVVVVLRDEIAQVREALEHRDEIGMAKGVIMATEKTTADEAFGRLVRASQRTNTRLREIARAVVETGVVPS